MDKAPQNEITLHDGFIFKKRYNKAFIDVKNEKVENYHKLYENNVIYIQNLRFYFTKTYPIQVQII